MKEILLSLLVVYALSGTEATGRHSIQVFIYLIGDYTKYPSWFDEIIERKKLNILERGYTEEELKNITDTLEHSAKENESAKQVVQTGNKTQHAKGNERREARRRKREAGITNETKEDDEDEGNYEWIPILLLKEGQLDQIKMVPTWYKEIMIKGERLQRHGEKELKIILADELYHEWFIDWYKGYLTRRRILKELQKHTNLEWKFGVPWVDGRPYVS